MEVYRIVRERWSKKLQASGVAARWNSKGNFVIYTSSSRALACLENVVHRSGEGLSDIFRTMVIEIPVRIEMEEITLKKLPRDWSERINFSITQQIGDEWLRSKSTVVLKIPSAIVPEENNYLINVSHPNFKKIKLKRVETFQFDARIS